MYNILRYIRQNRFKIAIIIIFIIFVYSIIRVANKAYEEQGSSKNTNEIQIQTDGTVNLSDKNCEKVIEEFLKNCTNGDYKKAYSYLSEKCKTEKYPTLEAFKNNYCVANAIKGKEFKVEKSAKYKYKIELSNILASGKTNSRKIIEYYTITVDNGNEIKIQI